MSDMLIVNIITYTPNIEEVIITAARRCYSDLTITQIDKTIDIDLLEKLISSEHMSPFEHASITFSVENISRIALAQLTRHRIASFNVESQRYNDYYNNFSFVVPDIIKQLGTIYEDLYKEHMSMIHLFYKFWYDKIMNTFNNKQQAQENARYVLPGATTTKLIFTMNVRELFHFFKLRLCNKAQKEIRDLANLMLDLCLKVAPNIFKYVGPNCKLHKCLEYKPCSKL